MPDDHTPLADPSAIVHSTDGRARFTILTERLVRMEWSPVGVFEERASQPFINRRLPAPEFRVERSRGETRIVTPGFRLFFRENGKPFHEHNLRVEFPLADRSASWNPASDPSGNLGGTIRTLDNVNGSCPVEPGLLSRDGWALVNDSNSLVFEPASRSDQRPWLTPRDRSGAIDWYLFTHGRDYAGALRDFARVAGRVPLPPRFVFGAWWSRYWAYTDIELKTLVEEFRANDLPLDVLVIDMDWHKEGWTGYSWSPEHFPDPEGFLRWTDGHGLQITLNLHPADGIGRHEDAFGAMCGAMGLDPETTEFVPFDCTDRRFVDAYFRFLHWPLEAHGVDFWWMDWQQGTKTNTPGLDPLWWLNHLHWKDLEERATPSADPTGARRARRPLVFSRWGGLGNHRYPIGFSGDTYSTWASLAWQPKFTAMAGNVGYAYWSHDIGGHQPGPVDPELYARWVQYGALSPVLRTHTSKNPLGERRIWAFPERESKAKRDALLLRYRLLPYIYTQCRQTYDEALPLCRPLYYHWPEADESYDARFAHHYMFGDDLLAAPVISPSDSTGRAAAVEVWIPPGVWTHWYSGLTVEGPRVLPMHVGLDEVPLFARGGAIIPAAPPMRWSGERPVDPLTLIVWPGSAGHCGAAAGERFGLRAPQTMQGVEGVGTGETPRPPRPVGISFGVSVPVEGGAMTLYEDDGESIHYEMGRCSWTPVSFDRRGDRLRVTIGPTEGDFDGMAERRGYEVRIVDRWPARAASINGVRADDALEYDESKFTIVVRVPAAPVRERVEVELVLDEADESPLRAGLHGWLKLYGTLGVLLGESAPGELRPAAAGEMRRECVRRRGGEGLIERFSAEARWDLARRVASCGAGAAARDEAVCRLLGLSGGIEVHTSTERRGVLRTSACARVSLPLVDGATLAVDVATSRAWRALAVEEDVSGAREARRVVVWGVDEPLHETSLRSRATVSRRGESVQVEFRKSVLPSINTWHVVGPFACPIERAIRTPFGPESRLPAMPSMSETYRCDGKAPVRWAHVPRVVGAGDDPTAEYVVDLNRVFGGQHDDAVAYAMTVVHAAAAGEYVLALGSDDGVVAWVNGERVHEHDVQRGYGSRQDLVPIRLRAGLNWILLKVTQGRLSWAFGGHVEDSTGRAAAGVEVRSVP